MKYLEFRLEKYLSKSKKKKLFFEITFDKPNFSLKGFDKLSSSIYIKKEEFVLKYENLFIHYSQKKGLIFVKAHFHPNKKRHVGRILMKGRRSTFLDYYEYFIVRKVIQNTFFAILENEGINVLHASTIKNKKFSTLFFGLGGLGKTTLALSLVLSEKLKLQGDNFVFADGKNVYSYLEPTRITKYTQNKISLKKASGGNRIKTFGKENFYLENSSLFNNKSEIKNIVFPQLSDRLSLSEISREKGIKIIDSSMKILGETPESTEISFLFPKKKILFDKKIKFFELRYKDLNEAKELLKKII